MDIGNVLKEAREEKGLTLDVVEQKTNIRKKYLQALEDENFNIMPGRVYAKGFLRNYAGFLGLDPNPLLHAFDEKNPVPEVEEVQVPNTLISMESKGRTRFWVLGLIVVALIVLFAYNPTLFVDNNPDTPNISQQSNEQNSTQPPPNSNSPTVEPTTGTTPQEEQGVRIVLDVVDQTSWMSVEVDGVQVFQGILAAGESREFKGEERINVRLGNPGVVEVEYNGEPIGVIGQNGQPVTKEFTAPQG